MSLTAVARRRRPAGMALIFVLLLLTMVLYLALSFLLRGNFNLFTASRDELSQQGFNYAEAAAHEMAVDFMQNLRSTGNFAGAFQQAVKDLKAQASSPSTIKDTAGNLIGYTNVQVYDAEGNVAGTADVKCMTDYYGDESRASDSQSIFGSGTYAVSYHTVDFTAQATNSGRIQRTVHEVYNVLGTTGSASLNFAYFMNNWAWWAGPNGTSPWVQLVGNTGANGNYDVLSGGTQGYGGPAMTYGGTTYAPPVTSGQLALFTQGQLRDDRSGISDITGQMLGPAQNQNAQHFAEIYTPDVSNIDAFTAVADGSTGYVNSSGRTVSTPGKLSVQTAIVTTDRTGNIPRNRQGDLIYTPVGSATTVTSSGVYPETSSEKSSLVLGSGLPAPSTANANPPNQPYPPNTSYTVNIVNISGTVVVKSDVVIQGFVEGRGTLASGRNVYLAGDVSYVNPPSTSPGMGNNGYPNTDKSPAGTAASSGTSATGDYTKDQIMLTAAGSVVEGDVTAKQQWWDGTVPYDASSYWSVGAQSWLDWKDPTSGANVSGDYTYHYYKDFAFANAQSDASGRSGFSSAYFDTYNHTASGRRAALSDYGTFDQNLNRVDGFVIANKAIAGLSGNSFNLQDYAYQGNQNVVFFGGVIAKQDAQAADLWYPGASLKMYQDRRFTASVDASLPSALSVGALVESVSWYEP